MLGRDGAEQGELRRVEIRIKVVGGADGAPDRLRRALTDATVADWSVEPDTAADELVVRLPDDRALAVLKRAVRLWEATDGGNVRATLHGPDGVIGHAEIDWMGDSPDQLSSGPPRDSGVTPPGPVLDPGDDWPEE